MAKLTLQSILSQFSSIAKLNANFQAIVTAFDNTLSRDGTAPNAMGADLDMNSNRVINLPSPVSSSEPALKSTTDSLQTQITGVSTTVSGLQLDDIGDVTITTPNDTQVLSYEGGVWKNTDGIAGPKGDKGDPGQGVAGGGTTGQVLTKQSSTDFDTGWSSLDTDDITEGTNLYFTDERAQDAIGSMVANSSTISFTYNDATPSLTSDIISGSVGTTQLTDDGVTNAKLANMAQATVKGRPSGSGTGDPQDISAADLATIVGTEGVASILDKFGMRFVVSLDDDTAEEIVLNGSTTFSNAAALFAGAGGGAFVRLRTAATVQADIIVQGGSATYNEVAGDGVLSGTTGPDGNLNIRCSSANGSVSIENRTGGAVSVLLVVLI